MISVGRIIQWGKQLVHTFHLALSLIVFTGLDFMDNVFCIIFAYLDEFFEGDTASSCYCSTREKATTETDVLNNCNGGGDGDQNERNDEQVLSETLYGDRGRGNIFRDRGWFRRRIEGLEKRKGGGELKRRREKATRWSDCGCESCVSWMKKNGDDLILHVVVQEPETSPVEAQNPEVKSTKNVVFLHGFISSSSFWTETVFSNLSEQTRKRYRLFAVDLLGFGRSPKPKDCSYTLKDHLEMIEKSVIVPFGLNSFHLVAHSMGSVIALALAAKHPDRVKSVTLVAPPYVSSSSDKASSLALSKLAGKRLWPPLSFGASFMSWYEHLGRIMCFIICRNHRIWELIFRVLTRKRDLHFMITDLTKHTHHSAWHTMHNVICGGAKFIDGYLEILSQRRVTLTVIQGDEDQVVPLQWSSSIRVKHPEVDVRIIRKADHITVVLNQTKEFTQILEGIWLSCN